MTVKRGANQNTKGTTGNWDNDEQQAENGSLAGHQDITGLAALFNTTSMTSDSRNMVEVGQVVELMKKHYKQLAGSTTPAAQLAILPDIDLMTTSISNVLPGLVMYKVINNAMWVMGVLFSNKDLTISSEPIRIQNFAGGGSQQISIPLPPTGYADKFVIENLRQHFLRLAESQNIHNVAIINMTVVDMEMLNHPESGDPKDRPQRIATYLEGQWETSVFVKITQDIPEAGLDLPSPFKDPKQPYGKDGYAEARVIAIQDRINKAGYLSAANMEVVASTINNINNPASVQSNSKEIARVTATVQLSGITYQQHMANLAASRGLHQNDAIQAFLGMNGGLYPNGYRPMHPVITMETAQAGEMMNYNQGLMPYFYGLYLLMTTNADYVFTEALRKMSVGARGNLGALEGRIDSLLQGVFMGQRPKLDDKTITDTDLVNTWIRQNVSAHATFRTNIVTNGPEAAVSNFLLNLSSNKRGKEVKTMIAVLNALSNGKFSEIIEANRQKGTGWTADKPALHRTQMIVVNGLAKLGNKELNTLEVDEMLLGHVKGKNGQQSVLNYLAIQYGMTQEDFKARCQKLRMELNQSIFDGNVHINTFAQSCVWDPLLMSAIAEALDPIGTLNVANTTASFRPNQLVFAPGVGLATMSSAGSSNINNLNAMGAFGGGMAFG